MRSQNNNRNNRSRSGNSNRNGNGDRAQAYAGQNYNSQAYSYNDYDREDNDRDRDYNAYNRSESDRYSNYEGNSGRGNYENSYDSDRGYSSRNTSGRNYNSGNYNNNNSNNTNNRSSGGGYNGGGGYTTGPRRNWDSQEPGYYSRQNDDRDSSHYGGTRRRDEKDWSSGDGRNYAAEYDNDGNYRRDEDRGFFGRVGDSIRNTWHDITDRDDTQDNMRRFKDSSGNTYNNRGNYHTYPEGSSDNQYGSGTWARNNNRGTYGDRRNDYGGYGLDRQDFNW